MHGNVRNCRAALVPNGARGYSVVPPSTDSEEKAMLDRMLRVDHAGDTGLIEYTPARWRF
uniref:Uncharacterized protein n=1 Tax=Anguilla anguilla TaxID=7936 RepID=A0A0E9U491_ANGAN